MIESLREAGKAAYAAAPNSDEALTEFLIKILADDVARDNYEPAADLSKVLVDNGCDKKELYDPAGIAAFATNDFDAAEKRAKRAQDDGKLSENGKKNLEEIPSYKKYWQEEQEIRKKEAEQNDLPRVRLSTSKGDMMIELFENEAPETVGNFISLVEQKFYDGLVFHRVLPAFMAQGGCPRGDGTGDPGYKIYCECYKENYRKHFRGTLSMAHAGKDTGGSQFFITFLPTPHLNGKHTAFGRVVKGMDVLAKLQRIDPQASGSKPEPDKIIQAEVIRKREHAYEAHKVQ
jgi:cyclophilin family peptidyl-prolyl cis-trans isomerase